jgi:Flp pilus assembly protein TadD
MNSRTIAFVGNCQAILLGHIYREQIAPRYHQVVTIIESTHPEHHEKSELEQALLADVIVDQVLDSPTPFRAQSVRPGTSTIFFPTVSGRFLWPFGGQAHPRNPMLGRLYGPYDFEHGDSFLNRMLARGVPAAEALQRYLQLDIAREANLDRLLELHLEQQRKRDNKSGIAIAAFIEKHFRTEKLFQCPGHPMNSIVNQLAWEVFARIGVPDADIQRALDAQLPYWQDHSLPIHPGVIRHFGLQFLTENSRWPSGHEGAFTFAEWVVRYMEAEWSPELREGLALSQSDPVRALALLEHGLVKAPRSAIGFHHKASILLRLDRIDEAAAASAQALALQSESLDNLLQAAQIRVAAKDAEGAVQYARRACELFPHQGSAHIMLATALAAAGQPGEALRSTRLAVKVQPYDVQINAGVGQCLLEIGELDAAEHAFRTAIALAPDVTRFRVVLVDILNRRGRREEAITIVRQLLSDGRADAQTCSQLGHLLAQSGDLAGAEAAFRKAVELQPHWQELRSVLAEVLNWQGRRAEALMLLGQLVTEGTTDPHTYARLGHMLAQLGDLRSSEMAFRKALGLAPSNQNFASLLAEVLNRQGRREEALVLLLRLVSEGTTDPHTYSRLGHVLAQSGDLGGAEQAFRKAVELAPAAQDFSDQLAEVQRQQGRPAHTQPEPLPDELAGPPPPAAVETVAA